MPGRGVTTGDVERAVLAQRPRLRVVEEAPKPKNGILCVRISDARDWMDETGQRITDTEGVNLQIKVGTDFADRIGWIITKIVVENDVSAFKRKKVLRPDGRYELRTIRPDWQGVLADLSSGANDGLLVIALDRAMRDPRDLEDLIDVVETRLPRVQVESVSGSLKLSNDAEVTMARNMVAYANLSSRDTRRRVILRRIDQAEKGYYGGGGRRPYGFGLPTGGKTQRGFPEVDVSKQVPAEAAEIRWAAESLLAGAKLRELAADLRRREVPTVTGAQWTARTLRDILLRPRNAGLSVYDGQVVEGVVIEGVDEDHPPILDRPTWDAVFALLTNPTRRTSPGPAPKWFGSQIYLCGHPDCIDKGTVMTMGRGMGKGKWKADPIYMCSGPKAHLTRVAKALDDYIETVIVGQLTQPEAVELCTTRQPGVDTAALATEANAIREVIADVGDLHQRRKITKAERERRIDELEAELDGINAVLRGAVGVDPLVGIAGEENAKELWAALPLAVRRAMLRRLLRVTVLPSNRGVPRGYVKGSGKGYFKPEHIRVEWLVPDTR